MLLLLGCESRSVQPKDSGSQYFPLKVGAFWTYDVLQTTITQLGGQTTSSFELKIQITDSISANGRVDYILERSQRSDATQTWTSITSWSARKTDFEAIVQEGNISYLRIAFPISEGKSWNGNTFNTLGGNDRCTDGSLQCDNYVASDLMKRFESTGIAFENTVTVFENNENDPIVRQDVRRSVYAKSVGLVYREATVLEYCTVGNCIGKQIVENGSVLKQTIKEYGGL
ncbi:MAG: hypothetical protein HOP08_15025 [Cyclobacteriaceae bacterium]|nr:hypothetical protein [Cyclobacteriaceae bacterium]